VVLGLRGRIDAATRRRALGAQARTGKYARSFATRRALAWTREFWPPLLLVFLLPSAVFVPVAVFFLRGSLRPAVIGAAAATGLWLAILTCVLFSGVAATLVSVVAEQWTSGDLRRLRRRGWRLINGLKFVDQSDIDHVAIGPAGLLVVETKWSADGWDIGAVKGLNLLLVLGVAGNKPPAVNSRSRSPLNCPRSVCSPGRTNPPSVGGTLVVRTLGRVGSRTRSYRRACCEKKTRGQPRATRDLTREIGSGSMRMYTLTRATPSLGLKGSGYLAEANGDSAGNISQPRPNSNADRSRAVSPRQYAKSVVTTEVTSLSRPWEVVVVGGGNAGLVSAISAKHRAKSVLLLERAPIHMRGGNTRHTRNIRCVHRESDPYSQGKYLYEDLWSDLCQVGSGPAVEKLAAVTVRESESVHSWMSAHGVKWQQTLRGTLHLTTTNRFFLGGGKALVNVYYRTAERLGVTIAYGAFVEELAFSGNRCEALVVNLGGAQRQLVPINGSVVFASGGFEANQRWLSEYWGDAARNYLVRGTPYNDGAMIQSLYSFGAAKAGEEKGMHAVAVDARSPRFDGGIATRVDCIPFAIVVNRHGKRFGDEGNDLWPKRYAIWGQQIAAQDGQIAYAIWDAKAVGLFIPPMYGPAAAGSLNELARQLGLESGALTQEVAVYNSSVCKSGQFDPGRLDGVHTVGLAPAKSNWAQKIDTAPYYGIALRPGITFTYRGVAVTSDAQVACEDGTTFANVFAAGENMSGNILSTGYLAGFGLTIGTVWGRIAGRQAAENAK